MPVIRNAMAHASGIPLGGVGAGTVEIRPDGYFHDWLIFNLGAWGYWPNRRHPLEEPEMPPGALSFFVRAQQGEAAPVVRRLGQREDQHNLYSLAWLKSVQAIDFDGRFPVARLTYLDEDLPVAVEATIFSPFIPHDTRASATPGFYAIFRVRNTAAQPVEVSLLGTLKNPLAWGAEDRDLTNVVTQDNGVTCLTMRTGAKAAGSSMLGSLSLAVSGGEASWICGEFSGFLQGYHSRGQAYGMAHECALTDFRHAGRLHNSDGTGDPAHLLRLSDAEITLLPASARDALLRDLRRYAFVESLWQRVQAVDPALLTGDENLVTFLQEVRLRLDRLAGAERAGSTWGDGALATSLALAPYEEREVVFTLGWHFPFHYSMTGNLLGHQYEHWFADAAEVTQYLHAHAGPLRTQTCAFADTLYDTTLEPAYADAWSGQLSTLTKCTWWTRNGDFGVWEGLGCCGFHTTDITYQGSFNILALFPELQQRQMELGARFQREDGRVHHFFTPDFSAVDDGFDRVDMNPQFVLLACRDYLWTGDTAYLRRLWPHIVRAMENSAQLDTDGDGLPDHDTRRNTYDAWNFFGTPAYIASLWLAALRAAIRLAEDLHEPAWAETWQALLAKGTASFEAELWNGAYYSLWVDGETRDECCMTDQLSGEWFTNLIGLGHGLPRGRVLAALRAIMTYNYTPEDGLLNANYPPGATPRLSTYRNLQQTAPWTGVEYAIAAMLLDFGLAQEGHTVIENIHQRYLRAGRCWNHVECGDHYYRAMSSWAVLLAATGFKVDLPRKALTVAPPLPRLEVRAPWVSATGWGTFTRTATRFELRCLGGELHFQELRVNLPAVGLHVSLNGLPIPAGLDEADGLTVLGLINEVSLDAGDVLVAAIERVESPLLRPGT